MKYKICILFIMFGIFLVPQNNYAQVDFNKTPNDDLGEVKDKKQELFFEALKQKGIENYDRAVEALLQCIELDENSSVFYFELGKNYNNLENYTQAEEVLKKAVTMTPDNEWYLDELYDVYAKQNKLDKAIATVKQLVKYHPDYKEDLAALYVRTKHYDEALKLLDDMDAEFGISENRDLLRNEVYELTGRKDEQIENLQERVADNPDEESNYLKLIYRYSENNEKEKAFETAKKLLEINPKSEVVHLALYKFYLEENNTEKALESMNIVIKSYKIQPKAKLMVLQDFIKFVDTHPEFEPDLVEATSLINQGESAETLSELGQYYLKKGDKTNALVYFEKAFKTNTNDFGLLKNILLLHIDLKQYEIAKTKAEEALLKYPAQPIVYLIHGVALNELKKPEEATETLEMGLDFIIDDPKLQTDFYKQLSYAYSLLNNTSKAKTFMDKARELESAN